MSYLRGAARVLKARPLWLWISAIISAAFVACYYLYLIINSLSIATNFAGYAADGPFQLYNPLRRLAAGQVPGKDFPFFHGLGIPLMHYIPFKLLGGNVFASETSRQIVSPTVFLLTSFVFFLVLLRSWRRALLATAIATVLAYRYVTVVYPSNSLIGPRTTFPVLVAAALLWRNGKRITVGRVGIQLRHLVAIVCLALAVLCGTEQGVAAVGAYGIVRALELFRNIAKKQALLQLVTEGVLIVVATLAVMTAATVGHPFGALKYALIDIPADQAWYFGTSPNQYLTWGNLIPVMSVPIMRVFYVFIVIAIAMIIVFRRLGMVTVRERNTYVFLLLYGVVTWNAMLGYFAPDQQFLPIMRGALLIPIGIAVSALFSDRLWDYLTVGRLRYTQFARLAAIVVVVVIGGYVGNTLVGQAKQAYVAAVDYFKISPTIAAARLAKHSDDRFAADKDWKGAVDAFSVYITPHATVWSTYSSMYESQAHVFNPSKNGDDYIIHALGKENREAYLKQFIHDQPEYVITLKPSYFMYEEWLWSRDWPLYAQLMSHYTIIHENGSHYLWRLSKEPPLQAPSTWTTVQKTGTATYNLPANPSDQVKLYEVRVSYKADSGLPLNSLSSLPRYLLRPHGNGLRWDVSLPPYEQSWTFGVPVMAGQSAPGLDALVDGLIPSAKLDITSVEYRELGLSAPNDYLFRNNMCSQAAHAHDEVCQRDVTIPLNAEEAAKPVSERVPD